MKHDASPDDFFARHAHSPFIKLALYDSEPIPTREWTVPDRFPRRHVGLLSGEGGTGKSLLMSQLGVAHALGVEWMASTPEKGPVLIINCEDDEDEIIRRLKPILDHYEAKFADIARRMFIRSLVGEDPLLATVDRQGATMVPTALYSELLQMAGDLKPIFIGVDNVADVFGGNEIDRAHVRQFVALMRKLAIAANGTVLLSSHPSVAGISSNSGLSGSTQWHNSVRFRCWLKSAKLPKQDSEAPPDPTLRELEFKKNNYGPLAETIPLRWQDGLYVPVAAETFAEDLENASLDNSLFMMLLERCNMAGRTVSDRKPARNYAPAEFAHEPEARTRVNAKLILERAMLRLFSNGKIAVETYGPPSNRHQKIVFK